MKMNWLTKISWQAAAVYLMIQQIEIAVEESYYGRMKCDMLNFGAI
jgi:hypothetical protein